MKIFVTKKIYVISGLICLAIVLGCYLTFMNAQGRADNEGVPHTNEKMQINLVTGEFKSETEDGEEIETYRWDPGHIHLPKGEPITLSIYGVNGMEHPFVIEGTDIKGTVKKGEETLLNLQFNEEGTYRLVCTSHSSIENNGPMVAYLEVK
ncbi:cupredoxin domain-containing protein [Salipaludibacillus sp. CF4.18]|uniref:cupredoxin domain-containing protein n=1 Tax=Salipaludibacillus sp. CF4.18 TaxID=3373081 RepID=UPI003EE4DEFF